MKKLEEQSRQLEADMKANERINLILYKFKVATVAPSFLLGLDHEFTIKYPEI